MPLNFPTNPTTNQTYTFNSVTWIWTGSRWEVQTSGSGGGVAAVYDIASTSTGYFDLPSGNTAQRPGSPDTGMIRYNSTTGFAEVYTSVGWGSFGAQPPSISTVNPVTYNGESGTQFTINGANFTSDVAVYFVTNAGTEYIASLVSYVGASQIVATTPRDFTVADEPLDVKVVQASGVSTKLDVIDCGGVPAWVTASGTVATINDKFGNYSPITTLVASDPDVGSTIIYSVISGSLPLGTTLNSSTGEISGDPTDVAVQTTSNFTVAATDNAGNQTSRAFNIVVRPVLSVEFLAAGGGAGGAGDGGGGGGAGGFLTLTTTVVLNTTSNITIGAGGGNGSNGSNSSVFGYTLLGGGTGGRPIGQSGGSGGGGNMFYSYSFCSGGPSTQNSTLGYGVGNRGGDGNTANTQSYGYGGGGGGANGVGTAATNGGAGAGGSAIASTISGSSVSYCGGGGGGGLNGGGAVGGGGGAANGAGGLGAVGGSASANTGSGGGGGGGNSAAGGGGGSGIIILKYLNSYTGTFSVGLTVSTANTGGYKISTITGGTGTVSFSMV